MASIIPHGDGWRAHVFVHGTRRSKTFRVKREAKLWADEQESSLGGSGSGTFEAAARRWLAWKLPQLDNPEHQRGVQQSIEDYALGGKLPPDVPRLGPMRLGDIQRRQLVALVRAVAERGTVDLAHRVGQRIRAIFDYAQDEGEIDMHPAAKLSRVLPPIEKEHQPAITPGELPKLLKDIDAYPEPVTRLGLMLLAHTFVRTSELIYAQWGELILNDAQPAWIVPPERMKLRQPHLVPLSRQALAILAELKDMTGESRFILASGVNRDASISNNTLLFALYRMGYRRRMTGHGFRAVASTVLNESGLFHPDAIERQLAHKEVDVVREAYHRAQYFEERAKIMQWYSDYLDAKRATTAE